jgi:hypothetical protein
MNIPGGLAMLRRFLETLGAAALGGLVVIGLMGAQRAAVKGEASGRIPAVIQAQKFVLRDAKGGVRAILGSSDDDFSSLTLYDDQNQPRISVDARTDGDAVIVLTTDGKPKVRVTAERDGSALVTVIGSPGSGGSLMASKDGGVAVGVRGGLGSGILATDQARAPRLEVTDPANKLLFGAPPR